VTTVLKRRDGQQSAAKFNAEKVRQEDLARMGGGVPDEE